MASIFLPLTTVRSRPLLGPGIHANAKPVAQALAASVGSLLSPPIRRPAEVEPSTALLPQTTAHMTIWEVPGRWVQAGWRPERNARCFAPTEIVQTTTHDAHSGLHLGHRSGAR